MAVNIAQQPQLIQNRIARNNGIQNGAVNIAAIITTIMVTVIIFPALN